MAPVMAMLAQMQLNSFLKFTKSTLFAGIMMLLLMLASCGVKAMDASFSGELYINPGLYESDTLELPETQTVSPQRDTIPTRRGIERNTQMDTTTVLLPDTVPAQIVVIADSVLIEETGESAREVKEHSPLKATMLSATLPGLGQAYNGKYWKIPFLYAGIGGVIYAVDFNNEKYQYFRKNWLAKVDGNPNTQDDFPNTPPERLQREMNRWRRNVEIAYIVGAALYILNILDATVDAHLLDFDVGDDLSLNIMPVVIPQSSSFGNKINPASAGIRLSFRF